MNLINWTCHFLLRQHSESEQLIDEFLICRNFMAIKIVKYIYESKIIESGPAEYIKGKRSHKSIKIRHFSKHCQIFIKIQFFKKAANFKFTSISTQKKLIYEYKN